MIISNFNNIFKKAKNDVYIRQDPSKNNEPLGVLKKGQIVELEELGKIWSKTVNGTYIMSDFLE